MKRGAFCFILSFVLLTCTQVRAEIHWDPLDSIRFRFRYAVDENGGTLYNAQEVKPWAFSVGDRGELTEEYDLYTDTISKTLNTDPLKDIFQMYAGAQGDVLPDTSLKVQGYAEMVLKNFDNTVYGVDVEQRIVSWMARRFWVGEAGIYNLNAVAAGVVDFNTFGDPSENYYSSGSLSGTVAVDAFKDVGGVLTSLPWHTEVSLDASPGNKAMPVILVPKTAQGEDVVYQFKVVLNIRTALQNISYSPPLTDPTGKPPFEGPFRMGNATSPIDLQGNLSYESLPQNLEFWYSPSDWALQCDQDTSPDNTGGYAEAVSPCGAISVTYTDSVPTRHNGTKTITRTWSATDGCQDEITAKQKITLFGCPRPKLQPWLLLLGN